jgi:uncharacterized protein (TIGR03905 family)
MKHVEFAPKNTGVCTRLISFDLDDNNCIHNLGFLGGCNGNLKAISKLVEGRNAEQVAATLRGNLCGTRNTSCADQLAIAIINEITKNS